MKIADLLPIDVPPQLGAEVMDELAQFIASLSSKEHLDIFAGPIAVRIITSFAALEREGTLDAFKRELNR